MIEAVIMVAAIGGIFGLILAVAGIKLRVETDPRIDSIAALLPGANCGGCGFAGCASMAEAIVTGQVPDSNRCAACADGNRAKINAIMGHATNDEGPKIRYIARLHCNGGCTNRKQIKDYEGINNCYLLANNYGGPNQCNFGCFGCGACVDACSFGAIKIGKEGLPVFDYDKCVGCGNCTKACPQFLIELIDSSKKVLVQCNNREKGKAAMTNCNVSCISCGICAKNCPKQAITLEDTPNGSIPVIDYEKCVSCGLCAMKCPRHVILKADPLAAPVVNAQPAAPAHKAPAQEATQTTAQ